MSYHLLPSQGTPKMGLEIFINVESMGVCTKPSAFGIGGQVLQWLESFITHRVQAVAFRGV